MIFVHKLLPAIVSPVALVLLLMLVSLVARRFWPLFLALILLVVAANPLVARYGLQYLEKDAVLRQIESVENSDAVVVLSGMVSPILGDAGHTQYEFNDAVDRFEAGIRLKQELKAPKLVFTRGKLPWSTGQPEGEVLAKLALQRGISPKDILITREVQNTSDEAIAVAELLGTEQRVILVTSAFHMPRAAPLFVQQGLKVDPFPVDFRSPSVKFTVLDLVPQAEALFDSSHVVRELLGRLYYRIRLLLG